MAKKCSSCGTVLFEKDIINTEKEYSYVCCGEAYDELEDVASERQDEAEYRETIIVTYECSNESCGVETTIEN
ncbi:MAG: hypothetical protein M0R46_18225 [Candidatus Muirbacterium halophilum]|nr:hypothetical protein [Candidatus Muirbacterium halophilum]